MKKRIACILCTVVLLLGFCSCESKGPLYDASGLLQEYSNMVKSMLVDNAGQFLKTAESEELTFSSDENEIDPNRQPDENRPALIEYTTVRRTLGDTMGLLSDGRLGEDDGAGELNVGRSVSVSLNGDTSALSLTDYYKSYYKMQGFSILATASAIDLSAVEASSLQSKLSALLTLNTGKSEPKVLLYQFDEDVDTVLTAKQSATLYNALYETMRSTENRPGVTRLVLPLSGYGTTQTNYLTTMLTEVMRMRDTEQANIVGAISFDCFADGACPEDAYLNNQALKDLIAYRDANLSGTELLISSFGYTTKESAQNNDYVSSAQKQADYYVRSFLIFNQMGISSAYIKEQKDVAYSTSGYGIIDQYGTHKQAFTYINRLTTKFANYTFAEAIDSGNDNVYIYRFVGAEGTKVAGKVMYALWTKTGTESNVALSVGQVTAKEYSLNSGLESTISVVDGVVTENLNETPIFITVQ